MRPISKKNRKGLPLPLLLLLLALPLTLAAQNQISRSVISNGMFQSGVTVAKQSGAIGKLTAGRNNSDSRFTLRSTIGQPILGDIRSDIANIYAGFWPENSVFPELRGLPLAIGAATAEVWNNEVYLFGGSDHWWGNTTYNSIYRFDGAQWVLHDSIPDSDNWGMESAVDGDKVFLLNGWPRGAGTLREYDMTAKTLTYLPGNSTGVHWRSTAEVVGDYLYLFTAASNVYQYDKADSTWELKTNNPTNGNAGLRSVVYNGEVFITGFFDSTFYKYNPENDVWIQLADMPYPLAGCAMQLYNGRIYCAGGSEDGFPGPVVYDNIISYDIASNTWHTEDLKLSDKRLWMSSVVLGGDFYSIGGFDETGTPVDIVEKISLPTLVSIDEDDGSRNTVPKQFTLDQNYPNPFNPSTTIRFGLPVAADVHLAIYNVLGQRVRLAVSGRRVAGEHSYIWDGTNDQGVAVGSGIYFYRLSAGNFVSTRKLILTR